MKMVMMEVPRVPREHIEESEHQGRLPGGGGTGVESWRTDRSQVTMGKSGRGGVPARRSSVYKTLEVREL